MTEDYISRGEFERALDRVEGRMSDKSNDVLNAISDLKASMNGQFARQGEILSRHETSIGILQDRSGRDTSARVAAGLGALLAAAAGVMGLKG